MAKANQQDESGGGTKTVLERLIDARQLEMHDAREDVLQAQFLRGQVPRQLSLRLQNTIVQLYYALRPLRNHELADDWWDTVVLSEQWIKEIEQRPRVSGDIDEPLSVEYEEVAVPYTGLDKLADLKDMVEEKTVVEGGMMGESERTVREQKVLDAPILLDISTVLDDATEKFDFGPDLPENLDEDDVDLEQLKGTAPIATIVAEGGDREEDAPDLEDFNVEVS